MIKYNTDEIRDLCNQAFAEIEEIEYTFRKFRQETDDLFYYNEDEKVFAALSDLMDDALPKMEDLVVEDIRHVFEHLEKAMNVVDSVDENMKGGLK